MATVLLIGQADAVLTEDLLEMQHDLIPVHDHDMAIDRAAQLSDLDIIGLVANEQSERTIHALRSDLRSADLPIILVATTAQREQYAELMDQADLRAWHSDDGNFALVRILSHLLNPMVTEEIELTPTQIKQLSESGYEDSETFEID